MSHTQRLFGIEEEFALLDPLTAAPFAGAAAALLEDADIGAAAEPEFLNSQLEISTPPCVTATEAETVLAKARARLMRVAAKHGAVLAPTGTPPVNAAVSGASSVTADPRYERIATDARALAETHYVNGLHVHVSIADRTEGVAVLDGLARWAPLLLAMSGNSPFCNGADTGFHSWRHIVSCAWPLHGYPAPFRTAEAYDARVERLVGSGLIKDRGLVSWHTRLSARYPTVELRIADVQLSPTQSVGFATVVRALVDTIIKSSRPSPDSLPETGEVNAAIWQAARDGLDRNLVDPDLCQEVRALDWLETLFDFIAPALRENGDLERARAYLTSLSEAGSPSTQQRRSYESGGIAELLSLYRQSHSQVSGSAGLISHSTVRILEAGQGSR